MFSCSAIFRAAWAAYRIARTGYCALGDENGRRKFLPELFAKMLRQAWADAKAAAARRAVDDPAREFVAAQQRATVARVVAMSPGERSLRISQIHDELTVLDYAPLGARTANRRRDLTAELNAFAVYLPLRGHTPTQQDRR